MNQARRILIVVIAYLSAAAAASSVLLLAMLADHGFDSQSFAANLKLLPAVGAVVAILMVPVALPIVVFHESRKSAPWPMLAGAGLAIGAVLALILSQSGQIGDSWLVAIALISASTIGTMTYWLIAWSWFPPAETDRSEYDF